MLLNFQITFGAEYGDRESTYCCPLREVTGRDWEIFTRVVLEKQFLYHRITEEELRVGRKTQKVRVVTVEANRQAISYTIAQYQTAFPGALVFTNQSY